MLLTLFIRLPRAASPLGIAAAAAAYALVDLYLGSSVIHTVLLNSGNMVSALTGFFVWSAFARNRPFLDTPNAALGLVLASASGSAAAGIIGAPTDHILFAGGYWRGWSYWFATEFNNYMVFLPALLFAPSLHGKATWKAMFQSGIRAVDMFPAIAVALSVSISTMVGGPGALAFPIPALLWAALTYSVFPTAVLVMLFSLWLRFSISTGGFLNVGPTDQAALASLRLGISLIALFPVVLSHVMKDRNELLARLKHIAAHDSLTGALNGGAFRELAQAALEGEGAPFAVFALDIDHFKQINDRYGHAAGDAALIRFARNVQRSLRPDDIFGRIGGEEFAVVAARCTELEAEAGARRIIEAVKEPVTSDTGPTFSMTVSIGLTTRRLGQAALLDDLLNEADQLLYQAKRNGRDRVETRLEDSDMVPFV